MQGNVASGVTGSTATLAKHDKRTNNTSLPLVQHQDVWYDFLCSDGAPPVDDSNIDNPECVAKVHLPVLCTLPQSGGACVSLPAGAAIHSQV